MAISFPLENLTSVVDLGDEDFFERFNLRKMRLLEKGSSGDVFLAVTKSKPRQKFAVKTLPLTDKLREKSLLHFSKEVFVMKTVSHPHLVPCTMAGRCRNYAAIAMPYYADGDLLLDGMVEPRRAHRYMSHVAKAVAHLHSNNIAHSDIKLENVFLDHSDRAHLGDFGLALLVTDASRTVPAWMVGGTRDYRSPERLEADKYDNIDPFKADIYAMGVMYGYLVSNEEPEAGTDYMDKIRANSDLDLPPKQRSVLARLLEPNPALRPTALEVVKMM